MRNILFIFLLPSLIFAWDFSQERNTILVYFDSIQCRVPWTTGYNYIQPIFNDLDGDNDFDLVFGSDWGRISYFINNGNLNFPSFSFETDNFVSPPGFSTVSQVTNRPVFCDIDNDNDYDLFIGAYLYYPVSYGRLYYYENIGNNRNPNFTLVEEFFQGIRYPYCMYPFFVDIDNDHDYDLFFGLGDNLVYFNNIGTCDSVAMILVTENFLNISLGGYYCIPAFIDIDADSDYDMFLGDEDGNIHYYRNDGTPQQYNFTLVSQQYQGINVGRIASPAFCDLDADGDYDLFVGERSWGEDNNHGDIWYCENIGSAQNAVFRLVTQNFLSIDIGIQAHPVFADINGDGLKDMFLGDSDGNINFFSNIGTISEPSFTLTEDVFQGIYALYQSRPDFGDLDGDGDLDMVVGRTAMGGNSVHLYRNDGTTQNPDMVLVDRNFLGIDYLRPVPKLADIDSDGDLDLFIGHLYNQLVFWENVGTPQSYNFVLNTMDFLNTPYLGDFCAITFGDIDNDGDLDLIRGVDNRYLAFYRNLGTPSNPNLMLESSRFLGIRGVYYLEPCLEDIDIDGDLDLFLGEWCGGVLFYRNNEISGLANKPRFTPCGFALGQNYPNPFNASTLVMFALPRTSMVRIDVYDILGRETMVLAEGTMKAGFHHVLFHGEGLTSGIYFCSLEAGGTKIVRKMLLLK